LAIGQSSNRGINRLIDRVIDRPRRRRVADPSNPRANPSNTSPIARLFTYPVRVAEAGFTMIELLVVVSLIVILATMGLTQYRNSVLHAREATLKEDLFRMRDAIDQYYADKGKYPATLDALVSDGYIRKLPEDPITKSSSTWQAVPAEPDPNNPAAEAGVFDVKSGAEGTTLDRTKYSYIYPPGCGGWGVGAGGWMCPRSGGPG
jgi:general secretion pathway protein G